MKVLKKFLNKLNYYSNIMDVKYTYNTECKKRDIVVGLSSYVYGGRYNDLSINKDLIFLEEDYLDYVAVHELTHIKRNDGFKLFIFDKLSYLFSILLFPVLFLLGLPVYFYNYKHFRTKKYRSWFTHILVHLNNIKHSLLNKYQKIIEMQDDLDCLKYVSLEEILAHIEDGERLNGIGLKCCFKYFLRGFIYLSFDPFIYILTHESKNDLLRHLKKIS